MKLLIGDKIEAWQLYGFIGSYNGKSWFLGFSRAIDRSKITETTPKFTKYYCESCERYFYERRTIPMLKCPNCGVDSSHLHTV